MASASKSDPGGDAPTNIGWHQDRQYWGRWVEGSELFTAWVALSDVTSESGPMRFVRGSHKWGLLNQGNFYGQDHEEQRQAITSIRVNVAHRRSAEVRVDTL